METITTDFEFTEKLIEEIYSLAINFAEIVTKGQINKDNVDFIKLLEDGRLEVWNKSDISFIISPEELTYTTKQIKQKYH